MIGTPVYRFLAEIPAATRSIADRAIAVVRARTRSGLDMNGVAFKPYTKRHARWRQNRGLPAAPADLTVSSAMLQSLTITGSKPTTFEPKGAGSKLRAGAGTGRGGQFISPEDVEIEIGITASTDVRGRQNRGKAWAHQTGISPRWKSEHKREWMGLSEMDSQQLFNDFGILLDSTTVGQGHQEVTGVDLHVMGRR